MVRVIDGDTIVADVGGNEEKIRFILVNTPEMSEGGETAKEFTEGILPTGTTIYLEKDISNRDKYGRLLRYVWVDKPVENPTDEMFKSSCVNSMLLCGGMAQLIVYRPDVKHKEDFERVSGLTAIDRADIGKISNTGENSAVNDVQGVASTDYKVVGNSHTMVYHVPSCRCVKDIADYNKVYIESWEKAESLGYRPCKVCHRY